jgi:hypothetical protein
VQQNVPFPEKPVFIGIQGILKSTTGIITIKKTGKIPF